MWVLSGFFCVPGCLAGGSGVGDQARVGGCMKHIARRGASAIDAALGAAAPSFKDFTDRRGWGDAATAAAAAVRGAPRKSCSRPPPPPPPFTACGARQREALAGPRRRRRQPPLSCKGLAGGAGAGGLHHRRLAASARTCQVSGARPLLAAAEQPPQSCSDSKSRPSLAPPAFLAAAITSSAGCAQASASILRRSLMRG